MLTCIIDAFERRDVATVNIPGVVLQTKMPKGEDEVPVLLDSRMKELLANISPETHKEYIRQRCG